MELTKEQKAKIFSMYLGCNLRVEFTTTDKDTGTNVVVSKDKQLQGVTIEGLIFEGCMVCDNPKLLLRPLSAINRDVAIEIAKMYYGAKHVEHWQERINMYIEYVQNNILSILAAGNNGTACYIYSYLIQQCYAVPLFIAPGHPDNGKTAIELGIAVEQSQ